MHNKLQCHVFISSTRSDLIQYRAAVRDTVLSFHLVPIMMEHFCAADVYPLEQCMEKVNEADLYIGILAHRYGSCPNGHDISFTELEFECAANKPIPRLCFLVDEDHAWPPKQVEDEPGKSKLQQFKAKIDSDLVRGTFSDPNSLRAEVAIALYHELQPQPINSSVGPYPVSNISAPIEVKSSRGDSDRASIHIIIDEKDGLEFDRDTLIHELSRKLDITPYEIEILQVIRRSLLVQIELPTNAAVELYEMVVGESAARVLVQDGKLIPYPRVSPTENQAIRDMPIPNQLLKQPLVPEDKVNVLLLINEKSSADSIASSLTDYGYQVYVQGDDSENVNFQNIVRWESRDNAEVLLQQPHSLDIAVIDLPFWKPVQDTPDDRDTWLTLVKNAYPDIGLILHIGERADLALEARQRGANRYLTEDVKTNHKLLAQTIQLLSVERAIQQVAEEITRYSPDILTRICQQVVKIFDIDHCGLVLFSPDYSNGIAEAEYPPRSPEIAQNRPLGSEIPVRTVSAEQDLIHNRRPLVIPNVETYPGLGPVRDILLKDFGICALAIVPIIARNDTVIASFSLDIYKDSDKAIDLEAEDFRTNLIPMCQRLAKQFAVAVENFRLQRALKETADVVAAPIADKTSLVERLSKIVRIAVDLLRAKSGGLYLYDSRQAILRIVVDHDRPEHVGKHMEKGEGMAGHLVKNIEEDDNNPLYIITDDYSKADFATPIHNDFQAVIEVALVWQGKTIGVLYIDDQLGRKFTPKEAEELLLLANQAASTIVMLNQHRQLQIINEVMKNVGDQLEPDDVLSVIVSEIARVLPSTHCTYFVKEDERYMVAKASCGIGYYGILNRRFNMNDPRPGVVSTCYREGASILTGDATQRADFAEPNQNKGKSRSMIAVPVKVRNQTQGVICVDQDYKYAFSDFDLDLVEELAQQAGVLIDRSNTLSLMQDISRRIISQSKVEDTLKEIVRDAMTLSPAAISGVIYRVRNDGEKHFITEKDKYGHPSTFNHPEPRLEKEMGITRRVIATRAPVIVTDIREDDPRGVHDDLPKYGVKSMAAMPLMRQDDVIGVLFLNYAEPERKFTKLENFSLQSLAGLAAIAIRNAELYNERERGRKRLEALYDASEAFALSEDPLYILQTVVTKVCEATDAKYAHIALFDQEDGKFKLTNPAAAHNLPPQRASSLFVREEEGRSIDVMRTGIPVVIRNVNKTAQGYVNQQMIEDDVMAAICLPLVHQGKSRRLGVLWIQYADEQEFEQREIKALQTFANEAAFAYDNAKRMQDLEQGLRRTTESLAVGIQQDYEVTRQQASEHSRTGRQLVYVGVGIIILGILIEMFFPGNAGLGTVVLGIITEAISLLVFNRIDKANIRMDRYHEELFEVRGFEQLMAATEHLADNEAEKRTNIATARERWLKSAERERGTDSPPLLKAPLQNDSPSSEAG